MSGIAIDSPAMTINVEAAPADFNSIERLMKSGARPGNEHPEVDLHLNRLIPKPWGYEYRAYADDLTDVWQLCLHAGQQTSMHSHPRKETYLLCLAGQGRLDTLTRSFQFKSGTYIRIGRGAFHQTTNTGAEDLHLMEVEMPRNKFDLIRLQDSYDRVGKGYETESQELHTTYKKIAFLPGAYMCRSSPCGRFAFSFATGMDIHYRGIQEGSFSIPIGVKSFLDTGYRVLTDPCHKIHLNTDNYYLSVTCKR